MMVSENEDKNPEFESQYSEICIIGKDLVDFNVIRFGSFIKRIDLSFNFLKTVSGLSICSESLEELVLDNNQLEQVDLGVVFPKLHTLSLNKNRIWNSSLFLKVLTTYAPNLRFLSLLGNPVCPDQLTNDHVDESEYPKYRCHILFHLKNIRFLDHRPVTAKELMESRRFEYSNLKLSSPFTPLPPGTRLAAKPVPVLIRTAITPSGSQTTPIIGKPEVPEAGPGPGPASSRQGKRMKYIGKNSEGNRFIKDTDL